MKEQIRIFVVRSVKRWSMGLSEAGNEVVITLETGEPDLTSWTFAVPITEAERLKEYLDKGIKRSFPQ
jgi:hypothetical protein